MKVNNDINVPSSISYFSDGRAVPDLMTMEEIIEFLRIAEISNAKDHNNVIKTLIRYRDLPRIPVCKTILFPRQAILEWIENETIKN